MAEASSQNTQPLKERIAEQLEDITRPGSPWKTLRLNVKEVASNRSRCIRKYELMPVIESEYYLQEKVVLVVGQTGAGKSTLVNSIANFVLGIEFGEDKRFILVREEKNKCQTESQTEGIASYTLKFQNGFRIPFTLTLIDTPGFGDTRGLDWEKKNSEHIKEFFSSKGQPYGIDSISAILFVVQSGTVRLSDKEKYIFYSILNIFGRDMIHNIFPVFTFSDSGKPKALEVVRKVGIPCQTLFKTNSGVLFEEQDNSDDEDESLNRTLWKRWENTIGKLLAEVSRTDDQSLILTSEVLEKRERLQCQITGLRFSIKKRVALLSAMKAEEKALESMDKDLSKEVRIIRLTEKTVENEPGWHTFVCSDCKRNCHEFCKVPYKPLGRICCVIKKGKCKVCLCSVSKHSPEKYHYHYSYNTKSTMLRKSRDSMREIDYNRISSKGKIIRYSSLYLATQQDVYTDIQEISVILKELNAIALRPISFSIKGYIHKLIDKEEQEKELGWEDRIKELSDIRDKVDQIEANKFDQYESSV